MYLRMWPSEVGLAASAFAQLAVQSWDGSVQLTPPALRPSRNEHTEQRTLHLGHLPHSLLTHNSQRNKQSTAECLLLQTASVWPSRHPIEALFIYAGIVTHTLRAQLSSLLFHYRKRAWFMSVELDARN